MKDTDSWRITVHPLADCDMKNMRSQHPEAFKDMMNALKQLMNHADIFSVRKPLDLCITYPDMDNGIRFKCRGQQWRVVMRVIEDGVQVRPSRHLRPGSNIYLQIVFVDTRSNSTYSELKLRVAAIF